MVDRKVVVAAHGHCFDGLVSAAMFTHLRRRIDRRSLAFSYRSCGYGPKLRFVPDRWLNGDENAVVDFRYTPSERLTWYFDHHATAFDSDQQRDEALGRSKRFFYEPTYGSCTKLIVEVGQNRYGINFDRFTELIRWADQIDSADFESAEQAIDRSHPAMQLAAVVEQKGDAGLLKDLVAKLLESPVEDVAESDEIQQLWQPLKTARQTAHDRIERSLTRESNVVFVDLHEAPLEGSGKFVAYSMVPDCAYSVSLLRMRQHFKLSIGYNPWSNKPRGHDIGAICQRHGGGGHPVVGAISMSLDQLDEARALARKIVAELNR